LVGSPGEACLDGEAILLADVELLVLRFDVVGEGVAVDLGSTGEVVPLGSSLLLDLWDKSAAMREGGSFCSVDGDGMWWGMWFLLWHACASAMHVW